MFPITTETEYNDKNSDNSLSGDDSRGLDNNFNNNHIINSSNDSDSGRTNLGDVIVFDTSLLEEFSRTSNHNNHNNHNHNRQDSSEDSSIVDITSGLQPAFNDHESHSAENNSDKSVEQNERSVENNNQYNSEILFDKNCSNDDNSDEMLRQGQDRRPDTGVGPRQ